MLEIQIDAAAIPKGNIEYLARGVLSEISDYFENPEVQDDYEEWLRERKKKEAVAI